MESRTHPNAQPDSVQLECTPIERSLQLDDCAEPLLVTRRLRALGSGAGSVLFESGDFDGDLPTLRWSFLVARALVRLELRSGKWRIEPLCDSGNAVAAILRVRATLPLEVCATHDDESRLRARSPLDLLRDAAGVLHDTRSVSLPPGVFGAIAYEFVDAFEDLGARKPDPLDDPDATFVVAQDVIVFDHAKRRVHLIVRGLPTETLDAVRARLATLEAAVRPGATLRELPRREAPPPRSDTEEREFIRSVERIKEHILAGDVFQAVVSRRTWVESTARPLDVYQALRQENPSPYMFCIDLEQGALLGSSPETFLRIENGEVESRPIAGTAPRGRHTDGSIDDAHDQRLALGLLLDAKELAEHMMLVDLARNDVARVCVPGTTRVVQALAVERYAHVQHLVSRVRGRLRPGLDAIHAYRAAANTGTLTGAPKPRAMRLLRELEPTARGFYGGAVGYLLADGRFDSCIAIRSLRAKGGRYFVQSGAGIVHDSDPALEFAETLHKARSCLTAVEMAKSLSDEIATPSPHPPPLHVSRVTPVSAPRILILDQHDSFVHILADQITAIGCAVEVHRSDLSLEALERLLADHGTELLVLSPGPGHPRDAEPALALLRNNPRIPVFGVCLGHQTMALAYGGEVERAPQPVHGKRSLVDRIDHPLFEGVARSFVVGRYHSLCVTRVPDTVEVLATTHDGQREVVMAMAHRTQPRLSVQFHPESCLTPDGGTILRNVIRLLCPTALRRVTS